MFSGRDLSAADDQPTLLPVRSTNIGAVRPAKSGEFNGGFRKLDGPETVRVAIDWYLVAIRN